MTQKTTSNYSQFTTDVFCCQSAGIAAVAGLWSLSYNDCTTLQEV